jgi:hypothetical protein
MEVLSRLNAFLGIMFVALLLEAVVFSFTGEGDIVGQAFVVEGIEGEVGEDDGSPDIPVSNDVKKNSLVKRRGIVQIDYAG